MAAGKTSRDLETSWRGEGMSTLRCPLFLAPPQRSDSREGIPPSQFRPASPLGTCCFSQHTSESWAAPSSDHH